MSPVRTLGRRVAQALFVTVAALALVILDGCASSSTQFNGVWVNPEAGHRAPVNNVLVIGINHDTTARRIYEDAIVAQLTTHGIRAEASYKLVPELGPAPPPGIETALRNSGFAAVLVSRTMRVSTDIRVAPGMSYGPAGFGGMWAGAYSVPPNIYTVENVAVETRLFDLKEFVLLWSGSSTTQPASSMQQTINDFATLLIKTLAEAKVIA